MKFPLLRARSGALLLSAIALAAVLSSSAQAKDSQKVCEAKPYVVEISAMWCNTCKALESTWEQLGNELGDRATFLKLDVSDRVAFAESRAEAKRLGIDAFFEKYRSKTGTIGVLDCKTREPVAVMRGERDLAKYRAAVAKADRSS